MTHLIIILKDYSRFIFNSTTGDNLMSEGQGLIKTKNVNRNKSFLNVDIIKQDVKYIKCNILFFAVQNF